MNLRIFSTLASIVGLSAVLLTGGCSRDHIEAVNLANEGDRAIAVNVESAISKYEQASQLDPTNHLILYKLAKAYEKKEDWEKMASTLSRAVQIAPEFANYWYKRGYALMRQGHAGNPDMFEEAKEPFKKCIEKDPNFAQCYYELGEAMMWSKDDQGAIENFTKAIEHDPQVGYFYPALAEMYVALRFYKEAEQTLNEGAKLVPQTEKNRKHLYNIHVLLSQVHQARGDMTAMAGALEKAQGIDGDSHPENAFNLGSTYAKLDPPQKEKAIRLLKSFSKKTCRGAKGKQFKAQCQTAQDLIQRLERGS